MADVIFTKEILDFMRETAAGKSSYEITELVNQKFNLKLTVKQIRFAKKNHKIRSGLTGYFVKGHITHNKGKKMPDYIYKKAKPTMFAKGHIPKNHKDVGTETTRCDGYVWVKVAEPNKWREKHVLIWEAANGPRPAGCKIVFADKNKQNFELSNLVLVKNSEMARLNQKNMLSEHPEITKTNIIIVRLHNKIEQKKKEAKP